MRHIKIAIALILVLATVAFAQSAVKLQSSAGAVINPATSDNQTNGSQVVKGNVAAADGKANPTTAIESICYLSGWNAATWDKINSGGTSGSAISTQARGVLSTRSFGYIYNGTNWDPFKGDSTNGLDVDVTRLPAPYKMEVSAGTVSGAWALQKFGAAPMGVQTTATDIWSRADSTPTQQIWLAPTAARIHGIRSSDANDDGNPAGTGARTITVYGLTSWSASSETSETITTNGTTTVNTSNSYVIIHRMKTATSGTAGPNVGTITAIAATDNTVTAVILPGEGQTEMAIYGIPSTKSLYLDTWCANIDKTTAASASVDFRLMVNETPDTNPAVFLRKHDLSLQTSATTQFCRQFLTPLKIAGPAIIKVQGIASSADIDSESSFDGVVK